MMIVFFDWRFCFPQFSVANTQDFSFFFFSEKAKKFMILSRKMQKKKVKFILRIMLHIFLLDIWWPIMGHDHVWASKYKSKSFSAGLEWTNLKVPGSSPRLLSILWHFKCWSRIIRGSVYIYLKIFHLYKNHESKLHIKISWLTRYQIVLCVSCIFLSV